jgi:hypothetical protein
VGRTYSINPPQQTRSHHRSPTGIAPARTGTTGGADLATAPASVDRALAGSGSALPADVRHDMEHRFGHDFSRVRIHADSAAHRSAQDIDAHAYTVGNHIVFGAGAYAPQSRAGSRLLAHELTHVVQGGPAGVRRYRSPDSFNFGVADDSALTEDSFNVTTDKTTKPWFQSINVGFVRQDKDADGSNFWKGFAKATYFDNPAKGPQWTIPVAGGSPELGRTDRGTFTVHRIEGVGYNSGSFSGTPGVDFDLAQREGPRNRYTKADALGDRLSNMSFAVFYNKGEALHAGPLDASSHGCVHVDWANMDTMKRLNYHSVIGLTKVSVSYP